MLNKAPTNVDHSAVFEFAILASFEVRKIRARYEPTANTHNKKGASGGRLDRHLPVIYFLDGGV